MRHSRHEDARDIVAVALRMVMDNLGKVRSDASDDSRIREFTTDREMLCGYVVTGAPTPDPRPRPAPEEPEWLKFERLWF